jgi:hypothetical protein
MRCSKAREFLSRHLDDHLAPAETGELDRHLDGCDACRTYRADLLIGQRLLAATEPELPENFDWKLQLRLNQTLREAAGEAVLPWHDDRPAERWAFLRSFGTATAAGLAAVLSLAMFLGPQLSPRGPALLASGQRAPAAATATARWDDSDRLPLYNPAAGRSLFSRNQGLQTVSGAGGSSAWQQSQSVSAWAGRAQADAQTIQRLRYENRRLQSALVLRERRLQALQTRLDTADTVTLDLPEQAAER